MEDIKEKIIEMYGVDNAEAIIKHIDRLKTAYSDFTINEQGEIIATKTTQYTTDENNDITIENKVIIIPDLEHSQIITYESGYSLSKPKYKSQNNELSKLDTHFELRKFNLSGIEEEKRMYRDHFESIANLTFIKTHDPNLLSNPGLPNANKFLTNNGEYFSFSRNPDKQAVGAMVHATGINSNSPAKQEVSIVNLVSEHPEFIQPYSSGNIIKYFDITDGELVPVNGKTKEEILNEINKEKEVFMEAIKTKVPDYYNLLINKSNKKM